MISVTVMCLALNVFHEARGESKAGQYAVALVTMNRAKEQNKPICDVVTAKKQFTWTNNGLKHVKKSNKFIGYKLKKEYIPKDMKAWDRAVQVAEYSLKGKVSDLTFGANHYYAFRKVSPYWSKQGHKTVVIGNHIFYHLS